MGKPKSDGTREWVMVKWSVDGVVVDPEKMMLVDDGSPCTIISRSNVKPGLTLLGFVVFGPWAGQPTGGGCLALGNGTMSVDIDDDGVEEHCSRPVLYCPGNGTEMMGQDQLVELGYYAMLPGATMGFPRVATARPYGWRLTEAWLYNMDYGRAPAWTVAPRPWRITPAPGFRMVALGPSTVQSEQGAGKGIAGVTVRFPDSVPPGALVEVEVRVTPAATLAFLAVGHDLPFGAAVVGDAPPPFDLPTIEPRTDAIHKLRVRAPPHAGDFALTTLVQHALNESPETKNFTQLRSVLRVREP